MDVSSQLQAYAPVSLLNGQPVAASGNTPAFSDFTTVASIAARLRVHAVVGAPSVTVKLQHSDDGSSWDDLLTFATATSDHEETLQATPRKYVRPAWTFSGSGSCRIDVDVVPATGISAARGSVLSRRAILFTETAGDGTYVGSVDLPPGASILDVAVFCLAGPWQAVSAKLTVGDVAQPQGYMHDVDLVGELVDPYDNADPATHSQWTNPNIAGAVYGSSAALYAAGNAVYIPTVRYPSGGTITATIVAVGGGPITSSRVNASDKGSGYAPGDNGTIEVAGGSGATYHVLTVDGGGAVLTYSITNPGAGYTVGNDQTTVPTSGGGDGAFALDILTVGTAPVTVPGVVVVDVIGFGVPVGATVNPIKT